MTKKEKEAEMLEKLKKLNSAYANIKPDNRNTKKLYFQTQSNK